MASILGSRYRVPSTPAENSLKIVAVDYTHYIAAEIGGYRMSGEFIQPGGTQVLGCVELNLQYRLSHWICGRVRHGQTASSFTDHLVRLHHVWRVRRLCRYSELCQRKRQVTHREHDGGGKIA